MRRDNSGVDSPARVMCANQVTNEALVQFWTMNFLASGLGQPARAGDNSHREFKAAVAFAMVFCLGVPLLVI